MRKLDRENQELSKENDELRDYSMNGFQIAKNIGELSAQREKLTCDLADQAKLIRELLEKNNKLQSAL